MAWYRPDQWTLLRAVSADGERLEGTYEERLAFASEKTILKPPPSHLQAIYMRPTCYPQAREKSAEWEMHRAQDGFLRRSMGQLPRTGLRS